MPPDGFHGGWRHAEPAKSFDPNELYGHINGGSEVFLELGFDHLDLQRYILDERELSVEIYHMTDDVAALGIYLLKCGEETPRNDVPARHTCHPYQLQLLAGKAYVTVNNLTGEEGAEDTLAAFARHVAEAMPAAAGTRIFDVLPAKGRVPASERVIRGPFTLERIFFLGASDVLSLEGGHTALAASYLQGEDDPSSLILVDHGDAEAAKKAFDHLKANLDPYLEVLEDGVDRLVFKDYEGTFGEAIREETRLKVRVDLVRKP